MSRRRNSLEPIDEIPDLLAQRATKNKRKPKRDRSWDAQRNRATYDLPATLIERIRSISVEMVAEHPDASVTVNDVARFLLEAGLAQYEAGELKVQPKPKRFTLFDD